MRTLREVSYIVLALVAASVVMGAIRAALPDADDDFYIVEKVL